MASPQSVDQQVRELLDHMEIRNVIARYCWALDKNDRELFSQVFAPDATAHLGSPLLEDIDAIWNRIRAALGHLDGSQHITGSQEINVTGDTATSRAYLFAQHIRKEAENGPHYVVAGEYLDQLVRTPDGWRIKYRILNTLWTEGNREVATGDK